MKHLWLVGAALLVAPLVRAQDTAWTHNDAMLTYFQAAGAIREHSLVELDYEDIVHRSLQAYLADHAPYSVLFTPTEYAAYRAAQKNLYNGIGMELAQPRAGTFWCIPYPDSPATLAGVRERDTLLAVDDQPITDWPLEKLGALIRGDTGSTLALTVRTDSEEARKIVIERGPVQARSVTTTVREETAIIRIYSFTSNTPAELRNAIQRLPDAAPIAIDLRGNPGGNLFDAVDAARLFLAPAQTIVEVRNRTTNTVYRSERSPAFPDQPVWILQDEGTASAAEVFTAALTDNHRAQSVGRVTFGKGRTQRIVELMNGSALLLTDGELFPPSGTSFDGIGLSPTIPVDEGPILPTLLPLLRTP